MVFVSHVGSPGHLETERSKIDSCVSLDRELPKMNISFCDLVDSSSFDVSLFTQY